MFSERKSFRFILLFFLYFSQGIPFGFQATALPLILRERNASLAVIGMATILSSPWMLKFIWAPLLDTRWNSRLGRRKTWIIPLQVLMIISILAASRTIDMDFIILAFNIFIMNLAAATQDVSVDGLAVDLLAENELGYGNAAQVVGYKAGMILSGGLLVWVSGFWGWNIQFIIMAVIASIPLLLIIIYNERTHDRTPEERIRFHEIISIITDSLKTGSMRYFLLFIMFYKTGEIMIDVMFKPFVIDSGFTASSTGLWIGTYGMAASICGSLAGGILSSRKKPFLGLLYASMLRLVPLIYVTALTCIRPASYHIITASLFEHFFGGLLTTTVFAFMMFNVDRIIGATHYTLFACIEVAGKAPGAAVSGFVAQKFGYTGCFIAGTAISAMVIFLLPLYKRSFDRENEIQAMHRPS